MGRDAVGGSVARRLRRAIARDPTEGRGTPKRLCRRESQRVSTQESGQVLGSVVVEVNGEAGVYLESMETETRHGRGLTRIRSHGSTASACANDAGGHLRTLDLADVTRAQARSVREFFLRQLPAMTRPTQVHRHDLLQVHGVSETAIGTIVPGTIVPILT